MTNHELSRPKEPSAHEVSHYFVGLNDYIGPSEIIKGLQKIKEIGNIPGVSFISPVVLLEGFYNKYKGGIESVKENLIQALMRASDGKRHPLIVRRLFPDEQGQRQEGPRSGTVESADQLFSSIGEFYKYYDSHYSEGKINKKILPEIMIHRLIDVYNPPKEKGLPHVGGDVVWCEPGVYQLRATFGADESTQSFSKDLWTVDLRMGGNPVIKLERIGKKTESDVLDRNGGVKRINIPEKHREVSCLDPNGLEAHILAVACHNLSNVFGPQRLEFNQIKEDDRTIFYITEASPFEVKEPSESILEQFKTPVIKPVIVLDQGSIDTMIPGNTVTFVHLPLEAFRRTQRQSHESVMIKLSNIARQKKTNLVVFASGESANEHAARVLWEHGHQVIFIGAEKISSQEELRVFTKDGKLLWERENPVVYPGETRETSIEKIGGKAGGLEKLGEAGFKIPKGFVIESSVMRRIIDDLKISDTEKLAVKILNYKGLVIDTLKPFIDKACETLPDGLLVIRSSANWEDQDHFSFAGHFHSERSITKQGVIPAVLKVIASSFNDRVISALHYEGINPLDTRMGVIVQEMIKGLEMVIFTQSTVIGEENSMRVEVKNETGQRQIVSLSRNNGEINFSGEKLIDTAVARRIRKTALDIKNKIGKGKEMDIEAVISEETGEIIIVQARSLQRRLATSRPNFTA